MKSNILILSGLLLAFCHGVSAKSYELQQHWFEQPIDHDKPASNQTLQQQVLLLVPHDASAEANVFFVMGNETDSTFAEIENLYETYGQPANTVFIIAEHRGYGQSQKPGDNTVPDYVSIPQVLADDYRVLSHYKKQYGGRVMVAGYSYGGALATQFAYDYPNAMDATLNSSGPIHWPFLIPQYSAHSENHLGAELSARLREHGENLKPDSLHDDNWRARELLSATISGLSQRGDSQHLIPLISALSYLPTWLFAWTLDVMIPEKGKHWSENRVAQNISFDMAQSGEFNWYLWKYQQCYELGTFFHDGPFAQSPQEYSDDCQATFGKAASYQQAQPWDVAGLIANINTPYIAVSGGKDPWIELGIKPDHGFANIKFIFEQQGFHCPDRDDVVLGKKVFAALMAQP